jgi:RNase P subunit RPR2
MNMTKECGRCNRILPKSAFYKSKSTKDGYQYMCKECEKSRHQARKQQIKITPETKVCANCGVEKSASEFHSNSIHKDGLVSYCKTCAKILNAEYLQTDAGKLSSLKHGHRRRGYGCEPLNEYFDGSHFHHLHIDNNHSIGIYIPENLHRSIYHNSVTWEGMDEMNELAFKYLKEKFK